MPIISFYAIPNIYHKLRRAVSIQLQEKKKTEKGSFLTFLVFRHDPGFKKKKIQKPEKHYFNILLLLHLFLLSCCPASQALNLSEAYFQASFYP